MPLPDLYTTIEEVEEGQAEKIDEDEEIMEKIREVLDLEQAARLMEIARRVRHEELTPTEERDEESEEEQSSGDGRFSWEEEEEDEGEIWFSMG